MSKPITSPISHKAATTLSEYENLLNSRWRPLYGNRPIAEISYEELALDVADFPRMAAKTFNNVMTPARQVWALAFKMRKVPENITLRLKAVKAKIQSQIRCSCQKCSKSSNTSANTSMRPGATISKSRSLPV
ncbi:hypothetical protein J2732_004650 [Achromobacter deleyi]|uniref:hypothetical protein n=1 Tax=Achromobacter deleyi TaxID=1353891 RepID=UPI0028595456|nr:hypothetical protein [Achromobacter deleyi]MDR6603632.1 hypothetical protein [Achromobacter deleyi]